MNFDEKLVPPIFKDCPNTFQPDKDADYANCTIKDHTDPCYLLRETHRALEFQTFFLTFIPIVLSFFAFVLNILYLIAQVKCFNLEKKSLSFQKRQIFLMSRSVSIILVNILFYVLILVWFLDGFNYSSAMIFMFLGCITLISITGTYIFLTILLYCAIVHHFWHKNELSMKHCYIIISCIWIIAVISSFGVGLWGATLFYPDSAPIKCSFGSCQQPLAIVIVVSLSICYGTVLGLYIIMMARVHYLMRKTALLQSRSKSNSMSALKTLGLNMLTFAIGTVPILIVCIVALANLENLSSLGEGEDTPCKTFLNSPLFVEVEILASVAAIFWLLSMIADPVINLIGDKKMRIFVWNMVSKCSSRIQVARKASKSDSTISTTE